MYIRNAIRILRDPGVSFRELKKRTLEDVLGEYIKLVLLSGLFASVATFLYALGRGLYMQLVKNVTVEYVRLTNYYFGIAVGTFFFYVFAGTFIFFALSVSLWLILRKRISYTRCVMILCYSVAPILLFAWVSTNLILPMLIWTLFLISAGVHELKGAR